MKTLGQAGVGQWPGHRIWKISPLFESLVFRADPLELAGVIVVRVEEWNVLSGRFGTRELYARMPRGRACVHFRARRLPRKALSLRNLGRAMEQ